MKLVEGRHKDETAGAIPIERGERETKNQMTTKYMIWLLVLVLSVLMAIGYGARAWSLEQSTEWPAAILSMATEMFSVL